MESSLLERDPILKEMQHHVHHPQQLVVGDYVYIKLHPYRQATLAYCAIEMLVPCFHKPFHILDKIIPVAYQLELPATACIHLVFHVLFLKRAMGPNPFPHHSHITSDWYG